ncbi:MAG TPA: ABC transporter permease [Candidatus Eisenbacteria bacterium]|nr:ABC transporter permease [Candidatus Eisenbacteria bacterium]
MNWLKRLFLRRRLFNDLSAEIHAHLDEKIEELVASGVSRKEATVAARREFGNVTLTEQDSRTVWRWPSIEDLVADVRYAARMLWKSPGFTAAAVLSLALGIGANTAIFSYIDAWLIKPLPYPQPGRLMIFQSHDTKKGWTRNSVTSTADFLDFQKQNTSFEQTAAWAGWNFNLTGDGPPELVDGGRVSWNYFDALGVKPMLGRTFTPDEDQPGARHVAVLRQGLWQSRFASEPNIIGRNITIGGEAYTVVGVMPGTFQFPLMGIANLWTPLALTDKERADRSRSWFAAFGRLKPSVTLEQAGAESVAIFGRLEMQFPQTNRNLTLLVSSMVDEIGRNEGTPEVMICFAIVGLILLIACANVANLMLARATNRAKEFAVRGALGATRNRLARQLLTESVLLFFFAGVAGLFFGLWGIRWIESQIPGHIRGYLVNFGHVDLDFTTLAFTLGIALLCGLVFGLAPAFENSSLDVNLTLKEASGQTSGSKRSTRLRRIFVAAEIALAVVVLISTTLLVKSFFISVRSSPGYNPANLMVAQLALPKTKYSQESRLRNFSDDVLTRIHALPQVVSAGAASSVPYGGFGQAVEVEAVGKPPQPGERLGARFTAVSPNYFSAMQIGLVKGRLFNSADERSNSQSVIINQTFARQFWPDEDPIGQRLQFGERHTVCTIVGVVNDIKMYYVRERPERQMYVPLSQFPSVTLGFVVRTSGDSTTMATGIRDTIWAVDRDQPVSSVEPLETLMVVQDAGNRVVTKLMVFFGALALFLGAIGIYGVMAHLVSQRTHEIGIRTALGARPAQVMGMVIGQGLKLASIGVAVGVLCALGTSRGLATELYQVTPNDPLTFIAVPIVFAGVAAAACCVPARRAMRVDPMVALRHE